MHKRFVLNIIFRILLFVSLIMLVPFGWAAHDNIHSRETLSFVITILFGILSSSLILWKFPIKKDDFTRISTKDGLSIVGLSWMLLSVYGAFPLYISGVAESFTDAFFEIVSGFTTTGATIFADVEDLPRGILFWRSLTHWLGGMGIIVLYIALLPALGSSAFQLYKAEAPGLSVERVEPRIKETAKNLWTVYFVLSLSQVVLLMLGKMPIFDALCHTFGTLATGGFSTKNASMGYYGSYVQWVTIVFMFLAGCNFILHYRAFKGDVRPYWRHEEFHFYCYIIIVLTFFFSGVLYITKSSTSPFLDSAFQVVSILTTTGYTTVNYDLWPHVLRYSIFLLMFIGGCGGSTAGGLKLARVYLSFRIARASIFQAIFPNAVIPVKANGVALPNKLVLAIVSYLTIFVFLFFLGAGLFLLSESCDLMTAMSATIASLSNIGPGLNKVGAINNYGWVSPFGKWLLAMLMLAGRLELYSVLILFFPTTWRK